MKMMMIKLLLPVLAKVIHEMITEGSVKKYGDRLFDLVEEYVADTDNTIDDAIILPVIKKLRDILNIPDLPDDA